MNSRRAGLRRPGRHIRVAAGLAAGLFGVASPASAQSCLPDTLKGQVLLSFAGGVDGRPNGGGLVFREGALYGATEYGGSSGLGSVYKLTPPVVPGANWTKSEILSFAGAPDGAVPYFGLVLDSSGFLYGVTYKGGVKDAGVVFRASPPVPPATAWTKQILHSFNLSNGWGPIHNLAMDRFGALYGVTSGKGAVFKLSPPVPPSSRWTYKVLYYFGADSSVPTGPLLLRDGEIFGVTLDRASTGLGTVFRLTPPAPPATVWTKTIIYHFKDLPKSQVRSSLVFDTAGALYGVSEYGGAFGQGQAFKLTPSTGAEWVISTIYNFKGPPDARNPVAGLFFDSAGALYGAARGGAHDRDAVFKLTPPVPPSTDWTESVIYSFKGGPDDGAVAGGNPIFDTNGALFGVTVAGGSAGQGTAFRLSR